GRDQVGVLQPAVGANAFGKGEGQSHDQVFVLIEKLVFDFHLHEEVGGIEVCQAARFLMLAGLLQIYAVAGTVERHLALLATALGTNAPMDGGAETLLLAFFADRTTHRTGFSVTIMTSGRGCMAERTTWEQPPSAVRRSEAPLFLHATIVELRSTGQPGGGCPRVVFASPFHRSM